MSFIDARCSVCGKMLGSWLTESGDNLVVEPCPQHCAPSSKNQFETDEDFEKLDAQSGCNKKLKSGQYFTFCGETEMGQTNPALCTECGGTFILEAKEI